MTAPYTDVATHHEYRIETMAPNDTEWHFRGTSPDKPARAFAIFRRPPTSYRAGNAACTSAGCNKSAGRHPA